MGLAKETAMMTATDTGKQPQKPRRRRKKAEVAPEPEKKEQSGGSEVYVRVNTALAQLGTVFAERDEALKCMMVATLTGMNYLLVGPRGTAKTAMAKCMAMHIDGSRHFSTLLGSFSTLSDLIGRLDLAALQKGEERRKVEGKILDCDTAFIDEALKGSDGVLNSLLGLLSDDRDFDGAPTKLWSVGSATNWPEVTRRTDRISALYDRFHIKVPVSAVQKRESRTHVLRSSRSLGQYQPKPESMLSLEDLFQASHFISQVVIPEEVEDLLCSIQERCLKESIQVSDRKLGQWQRALQAVAWLDGRGQVGIADFGILTYMAWDNQPDIAKAKAIVDSCDLELMQSMIRKIDEARTAYQQANSAGMTAEKASKVLDLIIATAEQVSATMKTHKESMRPESRKDVKRAIGSLQKDFQTLYDRFKPALEEEEK